MDEVVTLVDTYDMWKYKDPLFKDASRLSLVCQATKDRYQKEKYKQSEYFIYSYVKKIKNFDKFKFLPWEMTKITQEENKQKEVYDKSRKKLKYRVDNQGETYIYCEMPSKISPVAFRLLLENKKVSYIAVYSTYRKDDNKISLRALEHDVSKIAEKWGGGGHKLAAGATLSSSDLYKFTSGKLHLN
jgi:oligoribonuclease NrnB/cAMP/cGMP phosphodiesterase (DHH superfamily)